MQFKIKDYITVLGSGNKQNKTYQVVGLEDFYYVLGDGEKMGDNSYYGASSRLATPEEIIKAGGIPTSKLIFNYLIL